MKKILLLSVILVLTAINIYSSKVYSSEMSLTNAQVVKMDEFMSKRLSEIKKIEDEIQAKKDEIVVVKNTKIAERFQQEKIAVLNKDIKVLENNLRKAEKKYQKDYMKTYNSLLTKEQAKTMKLKKKFILFDKPCTLPSFPDNIKKERN